jgi:hypothetical protein
MGDVLMSEPKFELIFDERTDANDVVRAEKGIDEDIEYDEDQDQDDEDDE